jgi:ribonuclease T1
MYRMLQLWLILMAFCLPAEAHSHHRASAQAEVTLIAVADLPAEARATLHAIRQGGPFAYDRDGVVFGNYERALPNQARGYYHEYTVKTPGARNRGARRIIAGRPGEYYYSADHYQSFNRIRE